MNKSSSSAIRASHDAIQDQNRFVLEMWNGHGSKAEDKPFLPHLEDITVAGLGLAGEAGEVAEEVEKVIQGGTDRTELLKELGDARYYWFKLVNLLQVDLATVLPPASPVSSPAVDPGASDHSPTLALHEFLHQTFYTVERIKKYVRDRTDNQASTQALRALDRSYIALLTALDIPEESVYQVNQVKLRQRYARDHAKPVTPKLV